MYTQASLTHSAYNIFHQYLSLYSFLLYHVFLIIIIYVSIIYLCLRHAVFASSFREICVTDCRRFFAFSSRKKDYEKRNNKKVSSTTYKQPKILKNIKKIN